MAIPEVEVARWSDTEEVEDVRVHRFTRQEYERMAEVFDPETRVELVDGVIYDMSPHTSRHAKSLAKANQALMAAFGPGYHLRPQLPLALGTYSMPEPDLAVIAGTPDDAYEDHPTTAVLVVEVTDSSQHHDRRRKAKLYAQTGLPDYWILNLRRDAVEVLRDPENGAYRTRLVFHRGERISPLARPEVAIAVEDLLPRQGSPAAISGISDNHGPTGSSSPGKS
jgi:Uma2 family endonuclease